VAAGGDLLDLQIFIWQYL